MPDPAWACDYATDRRSVHIHPVADQVDHSRDTTCLCGPVAFHVPIDGADLEWLYLHHALDGRRQAQKGVLRPAPVDDITLHWYRGDQTDIYARHDPDQPT